MDLLRSLPLGLYLEQPVTWMHRLDSRVKLGWLMTFLVAPLLASVLWRVGLVVLLIGLTLLTSIPLRVWRQQMGWLLAFCLLLLTVSATVPDGLAVDYQPRQPPHDGLVSAPATDTSGAPDLALPQPTNYHYVLLDWGPLHVTRRSLNLGLRLSTLLFTLIYSTNLYLLTTAPEEITAGLEELLQPLRCLNWPVTEISLTLTLSLRFIPMVMEEVQNLARAVRTRAVNWKKLGLRGAIQIWMMLAERLLANLFLRAEQVSSAMEVRGFTNPNQHQVQWHELRLGRGDWLALGLLVAFWWARLLWGWE